MVDVKHFIFEQLEKLTQFSAIGVPLMLVMNIAISLFNLMSWREVSPYIIIPLLTMFLFLCYLSAAHVVVKKGETYTSRARAIVKYNPYSVWALSPLQSMFLRHIWIPILREQAKDDDALNNVAMVENWLENGFISKEEFPDNLKEFYIAKKGRRL